LRLSHLGCNRITGELSGLPSKKAPGRRYLIVGESLTVPLYNGFGSVSSLS
jgi:hypothetical protein